LKQTTRTIVVVLSILVYITSFQSTKPDSIPLSIVKDALAQENYSLQASQEQTSSNNSSLLNLINQTLDEPENINVTSRDTDVQNQTKVRTNNQTTNGVNGTNANGTAAEILNNAFRQQLQPPLQSPFNQLPAPQSQPQQPQQPPTLQQEQPPLLPPLNLMPPPSSLPQQQQPLPPLITPPLQQQPSNVIPPPSGPIYPIPPFLTLEPSYQSPVLLSQNSYYSSTGSMHIVYTSKTH
jgi:hypothetical protein